MTSTTVVTPKRFRFSSPLAAFASHLRYSLQDVSFLCGLAGLLFGGVWLWLPLIVFLFIAHIGTAKFADDLTEPENPPHALHDFFLRIGLPLMLANGVLLAYYFTSGDPLHIAAGLKHLGIDLDAARAATSPLDKALGVVVHGFSWGMGQTAGHELSHRLNSKLDLTLARWIGGLGLDPVFFLHHPFCHHRFLGLMKDPGTARRGESLYTFTIRCVIGNTRYAAKAEADRLRRQGRSVFSFHNRFITSWGISVLYLVIFIAVGGPVGGLAFIGAGIIARMMLESIAFIEHFGLFRVEGEPLDHHLSWDVYRTITGATLYNVARHTDHHLHPLRHCADLKLAPEAPCLPYTYVTLVMLSFIPLIYKRLMKPYLDNWDRTFATPAELAYMREHNIPHAESIPAE
ncbi:MAG: fatty acid desaturase [Methylovirgula sp.]